MILSPNRSHFGGSCAGAISKSKSCFCTRFVRCGLFDLRKNDLADVDISGQKSGFAIGEVVFPKPPEPVVEAERDQVRPGGAEVISPGRECLGIILPENALANNGNTEPLAKRLENLRRWQH